MRKITIVSTLSDVFDITTAETSFDAFVASNEFSSKINPSGMRIRIKGSDTVSAADLNSGDTMPNVDFVMFISPKKVKSGK